MVLKSSQWLGKQVLQYHFSICSKHFAYTFCQSLSSVILQGPGSVHVPTLRTSVPLESAGCSHWPSLAEGTGEAQLLRQAREWTPFRSEHPKLSKMAFAAKTRFAIAKNCPQCITTSLKAGWSSLLVGYHEQLVGCVQSAITCCSYAEFPFGWGCM